LKCHSSAIFTDDTRSRNPPDWRNGAARGKERRRVWEDISDTAPHAGLAGTLRPGAILHPSWVSVVRRIARSLAYLPAEAEARSRRRGIPALFSPPSPGRPFSPNEPISPAAAPSCWRNLRRRRGRAAGRSHDRGCVCNGRGEGYRGHTVGNNLCDPRNSGYQQILVSNNRLVAGRDRELLRVIPDQQIQQLRVTWSRHAEETQYINN